MDNDPRDSPREMGWLKVVVVVAVSLCVAQVALLKESESQSDIRSVHTPSNQVFF